MEMRQALPTSIQAPAIRTPPTLWKRLLRNKEAVVGMVLVAIMLIGATFAPILAPHDPLDEDTSLRLRPPMGFGGHADYPFGTDPIGRDVLSRVLYGSRVSLAVALVSNAISTLLGLTLGLVSGYYGKWVDNLIMRLCDIQLSFPLILLAIAIIAVIGRSTPSLIAVLSFTGWVGMARTVRASVLSVKEQDYVTAARSIGAGSRRILARHVLPNCVAAAIVLATVHMGNLVLIESSLSFFGLGTLPPHPSLGGMLAEGRAYLLSGSWWLTALPGVALSMAVLGINMLGDGLRDTLDPKLRNRGRE